MNFSLQNRFLTATFKAEGAELCALTDHEGLNYIWTADATYWGRHTPILFPLVGKITGDSYTHNGTSYKMGAHGFARDRVFEVVEQTETTLTFKLASDESTLTLYPFAFNLYVSYVLNEKTLEIHYKVENTDTTTIGFKLGAHPGFRCPLTEGETFEDYTLSFDKEEKATCLPITPDVYLTGETTPFEGQDIPVTHTFFEKGVCIFTDLASTSMTLRSNKTAKGIRVDFEGFPYLGIWSPENTPSPFLCIEPWMSHADRVNESAELMEKASLVTLPVGETFTCMHSMTVL